LRKKKYCVYLPNHVRAAIEYCATLTGCSFSDVIAKSVTIYPKICTSKEEIVTSLGDTVEFDSARCTTNDALNAYCKLRKTLGVKVEPFTYKLGKIDKSFKYDPSTGEICTA